MTESAARFTEASSAFCVCVPDGWRNNNAISWKNGIYDVPLLHMLQTQCYAHRSISGFWSEAL